MLLVEHSSLGEVDAAEWNALADARSMFLTHAWLVMVEGSAVRGKDPRYFAVRDEGGRLVGALPAHFFEEPPSWLYDPAAVFAGCDPIEAARWFPAVIAGGCSEFRGDILIAADLERGAQEEVTRMLVEAAEGWARERSASLQLLYMPLDTARRLQRAITGQPCAVVFQDVEQILRVRDDTVEDYVQNLPKGRRETVRREIREYAESDVRTVVVPLEQAPLDQLARLHTNLMHKYGHDHEEASSRSSFESQSRQMGDAARVFMACRGEDVSGFSLCYEHAGSLYVRVAGFDYDSDTPFAYSNMMFYAPLATAIAEGLDDVQLGLSTNKAKLLRGADAVALYAVLCPVQPFTAEARSAAEVCSGLRLEEFWSQFGTYVVHQELSDLKPD